MPLTWAKTSEAKKRKGKKRHTSASSKAKAKAVVKPKVAKKTQRKEKSTAAGAAAQEMQLPRTMEPFSLETFVRQVWRLGGYEPVERPELAKLQLASGCTGSGSFAYVCRHMLKVAGSKVKGVDLYGADWSTTAQAFLLRNRRVAGCLFQDMDDILEGATTAPCVKHCTMCPVPASEDIYQVGFACCWNSAANPKRFKQDIIENKHPVHDVSYQATLKHIRQRKPKISILENTTGLRLSRGGGNPEPALNHVMEELRGITPSVGLCTLDAKPLPTTRSRLFFYVGMHGFDGEALAKEAQDLEAKLAELPQHHISSFLNAETKLPSLPLSAPTAVDAAVRNKDYYAAFASGLQKAVQKKRLPADITPGTDDQRPSLSHDALKTQNPWLQAQADLYFLIGQSLVGKQKEEDRAHMIADLSQSTDRGNVTFGHIPACCTGTLLYHYGRKSFINAPELFDAHGFNPAKLSWKGLSPKDSMQLLGNITAATSLVVALTPVFHAFGVLKRS